MNPAMLTVLMGFLATLVPLGVIIITRFSDRKKDRASIASTDATRDKTYQEMAVASANEAEAYRLRVVAIRKVVRRVMLWIENHCLPVLDVNDPAMAQEARKDIAELDELL